MSIKPLCTRNVTRKFELEYAKPYMFLDSYVERNVLKWIKGLGNSPKTRGDGHSERN